MKPNSLLVGPVLRVLAWTIAATFLGVPSLKAHPYASRVINNSGTIQFTLNEDADSVKVVFDNGTSATNDLGALPKGVNSFSLGAHTNFLIIVYKLGSGAPSLISNDTNRFSNFWGPRGVTVNRSPKTSNFGRTYVVNASAGTQPIGGTNGSPWGTRVVTRGIYMLNPDQTDAVGQGDTARTFGMTLGTSTTYSPFKLSVGPDDMLYVGDGGGVYIGGRTNGVWMVAPDCSSGTNLFELGNPAVDGGVVGTPIAFGSLAAGNLTLYSLMWDLIPYQTVWRYDIGAGPLPVTTAPTAVCNAGISSVNGVVADLAFGPDGRIYTLEYRATPGSGSVPIRVFDPAGTPQWNSWDDYGASYGDPYAYNRGIAVSSDGTLMATVVGTTGNFTLTRLVNGIPDAATFTLVTTGFGSTAYGIAFDAANNVYLTTSGLALLRVYSLGMTTTAITGNDTSCTNGTFRLISPATTVSVTSSDSPIYEEGTTTATYTITRNDPNGDYSAALPVSFSFGGTATFGADYTTSATNTVLIPANQTSVNVTIKAVNDTVPELQESAVLTLGGGAAYSTTAPRTAQVDIVDNEQPQIRILSLSTNVFEGNTNDYARITLLRYGDVNQSVTLDTPNFAFGGTAVKDVDYYITNLPITFDATVVTQSFNLIYPIKFSTAVGSKTIIVTNLATAGFTVTNNTATTTLTLEGVPPEVILWSDNFENPDDGTNWNVLFATANNATTPYDATVAFYYDYAQMQGGLGVGLVPPLPPAPHSTGTDTHGVFMTVNKNNGVGAAVNLYPILANYAPSLKGFSNNFALRFDMYLVMNTLSGTTEYSLFGINHSGTKTNWFRNSGTGVDAGTTYDGLWYDLESDAAALGDYVLYSSPAVTNSSSGYVGPTSLASRSASTLTQVFKNPPHTAASGSPANIVSSATPSWAEVEISQLNNVVTWKINNTVIFSYTNTTAYTNGNIMIGYSDAYDSLGNGSSGAGEACAIYDNIRVVRLSPPSILVQPSNVVAPVGATTNLAVTASTGTGVTNYQWYFGSTAVAGATTSKLTLSPVAKTNFGSYTVRVDDGAYATASAAATLMPPIPVINTQPISRAGVLGGSASFSVVATTYSGTTNYQWRLSSANLSGKTNATLTLTPLQTTNFGQYSVTISDGYNTTLTSSIVQLTIAAAPVTTVSAAGNNLTLSFGTEVGPSYVVEYKNALTNGAWIPISTNAGTGAVIPVTDSLAAPARFYRIRAN